MTNDEFEDAVKQHADLINSIMGDFEPEDVLEVMMHSTISLIHHFGQCCSRGVIEFQDHERWSFHLSSHDEEVAITEQINESEMVH
jgi:hypothetical protein